MKHEESNLRTKEALANSLKNSMQKKPFLKITVSELIRDCNVNRNTFYYHFDDIFDLLKWMLSREIKNITAKFDLTGDYEDAIRSAIHYIQENAHILNCAYDSIGRDELKRLVCEDFGEPSRRIIEDYEQRNGVRLNSSFRNFFCEHMAEAAAGIVINGFKDRKLPDEEEIVQNVSVLLSALPDILEKAPHTVADSGCGAPRSF